MASRPPQHTKRTKTFTGCWTCRERKVKCDEASPHCRQCRRKGLTCQGYNTRLQWLPPVLSCAVDSSGVSLEPVEQIGTSALRRTLPTGRSISSMWSTFSVKVSLQNHAGVSYCPTSLMIFSSPSTLSTLSSCQEVIPSLK